jgi:hypothetical protein
MDTKDAQAELAAWKAAHPNRDPADYAPFKKGWEGTPEPPTVPTSVTATYRQIKDELNISSQNAVAIRIKDALAEGMIERVDTSGGGHGPGRAPGVYRILISSSDLRKQIDDTRAMPAPGDVEADFVLGSVFSDEK